MWQFRGLNAHVAIKKERKKDLRFSFDGWTSKAPPGAAADVLRSSTAINVVPPVCKSVDELVSKCCCCCCCGGGCGGSSTKEDPAIEAVGVHDA